MSHGPFNEIRSDAAIRASMRRDKGISTKLLDTVCRVRCDGAYFDIAVFLVVYLLQSYYNLKLQKM